MTQEANKTDANCEKQEKKSKTGVSSNLFDCKYHEGEDHVY